MRICNGNGGSTPRTGGIAKWTRIEDYSKTTHRSHTNDSGQVSLEISNPKLTNCKSSYSPTDNFWDHN